MPDLLRVALRLVVAAPFLVGAAAGASEDAETDFRFVDPEIVESSGLVTAGLLVVNRQGKVVHRTVGLRVGGMGQLRLMYVSAAMMTVLDKDK